VDSPIYFVEEARLELLLCQRTQLCRTRLPLRSQGLLEDVDTNVIIGIDDTRLDRVDQAVNTSANNGNVSLIDVRIGVVSVQQLSYDPKMVSRVTSSWHKVWETYHR
jgi:uncharacterized protein YaaQ